MQHQPHELETLSIGRLLIKFSIPAITGTVVTSLYNIVDRIFLGRYVGELGIAATTVAMPMMMIVMAFGMLIGFGTNSQISIRLGEKRPEEAEKLLGQGILLFIICALSLTFGSLIFLKPLLRLFGATENVLPYATSYLSIVMLGTLPSQLSFGANSFIRAEGNPKIAMLTMIIGGACNILFDYIFIVQFGWGMQGAALATVIGYSISAAWVLHYYLSGNSAVKFYAANLKIKLKSLKSVMMMGSPHFIMNIISSVQMSLFNNQLAHYGGDIAISIMGVILSFNFIWLMPIIGISQGLQPIAGYNTGANRPDRVKRALIIANCAAFVMCTGFFILIMLFPEKIFQLFTSENTSEFVLRGAEAIQKFLCIMPVVGCLILTGNYFQFTGRPKISLALTVGRQIGFLIPLILLLPGIFGLDGVWYAMPASDLGALVLTLILYVREIKNLNRQIAQQKKNTQ